jgi:thiamine-phosphate pyrophosphorylase
VIGLSTHDLGQARQAEQRGADYLGFGPIFETITKATGYTPRGLAELREIRRAVRLPIAAIGGIREDNADAVLAAGADVVAIISELVLAADSTAKTKNVLAKLRSLARP